MNETARAECPEGFATNEDDYCFPLHREGCPVGYHGTDMMRQVNAIQMMKDVTLG